MAVYVDAEGIRWRGREWNHLVADSLDELHAFADKLGLRRSWFQSKTLYPHYDVTKSVRTRALAMVRTAQTGKKLSVAQGRCDSR